MRGDLAAALLHEPPILYLDEPTIGLDLVAKLRIREFLAALNRETGATILLTTHDLADIESLCRRIIVIDHGHIVHDGNLEALRARFASTRQLTIDFDEAPRLPEQFGLDGIRLERLDGPRVRVSFERRRHSAPEVLATMSEYGAVRDMSIDEPAIEDVIQQLYASAATP
jgi:ABC-2 type transport system ATP-binding protein